MTPATRNIGAGGTILSTTDNILNIDTTLGAAIITLPSISAWFELKNKSGAIYDADGLRWTDVGGAAATNNITFVAANGDLINGVANIVVSTNGASGIITPTLDADGGGINGWEFNLVGATSGAKEYDVFGVVEIDNPLVQNFVGAGVKKAYAPNFGGDQGCAVLIGGAGSAVLTVSMPDLTETYGGVILFNPFSNIGNSLLTSFSAPQLNLITGYLASLNNPLLQGISLPSLQSAGLGIVFLGNTGDALAFLNFPALRTIWQLVVNVDPSNNNLTTINIPLLETAGDGIGIYGAKITSLDLSSLVFSYNFNVQFNVLLTNITLNPAINCTSIGFAGNALTQTNVDAILSLVDAGGVTKVVIDYDTLVGTFVVGETITGGTSGATAVIVSDNGSEIVANTVLGTFVNGETITGGTSAATANTTSVTLSFIDLSGGTNGIPTAAGLASAASLVAKGWEVFVNS